MAPAARERAFGQADHVRIYGRDFAERIPSAGFHVSADRFVLTVGDEAIQRYALRRDHETYLAVPRTGADEPTQEERMLRSR